MRKIGDPMLLLIVILIAATITVIAAYFLGRQVERNRQERNQMQSQIAELSTQVANLSERLNGRHLSNRAIAGVEDATAIAIDLVFTTQELEARLGNLRTVLGILRNTPEKYDSDRQSGYKRGA